MKKERIPEIHFYEWGLGRWSTSMTRAKLDAAGRGIYRELLDLCYSQGSIPNDFDLLARHCGATREEFDRTWSVIKKHFTSRGKDASVLTNKFADLVRREYFKYIDEQRSKGKASGEERKRRIKSPVPIRSEAPVQINPDSGKNKNEPKGEKEGEKDTTARGRGIQEQNEIGSSPPPRPAVGRFNELLAEYPNQTGTDAACRFYLSELQRSKDPEALPDLILAGIRQWKASSAWRNNESGEFQPQYIPAFHRFLGHPEEGKPERRYYLENPPPWKSRPRSPTKAARDIHEELRSL